jgi:hypothetical protein
VPRVPAEDAPPELGMPRLGSVPCPHIDPPVGALGTIMRVRSGFAAHPAPPTLAAVAALLAQIGMVDPGLVVLAAKLQKKALAKPPMQAVAGVV